MCKISALVAGFFCLGLWSSARAESAPSLANTLTLRQMVGQVFIWTYGGTSFLPSTQSALAKYQPGALIVFGRNIQSPLQIAKVNEDTQAFAKRQLKAPLFLMIDQEGGTVTRMHTSVPLPSALALGKMDDEKFLSRFGKAEAELLRAAGFNVNLAPVLDIANPEKGSFIGNRAFGEDPDKVSKLALAYSEGLSAGGLMPTAKHFPGHGGVVQDSHLTLPQKLATYDELADHDLIPFEEYAQSEFPKALMMAHLALPNIDPSGVPSTYSKILIQDYLRGKLEYTGLIITDDLEMNGASIEKDIGERAVRAFLAGNDMLMLAGPLAHQKRAFEAFYQAVKSGRISRARLEQSVNRILGYKKDLNLGPFKLDAAKLATSIAKVNELSRQVLKRNFQLSLHAELENGPRVQPETKALVFSADRRFFESFQKSFKGQASYYQLTPKSLLQAESESNKYDLVVFYASGAQTARWLSHTDPALKAKMIVINTNNPGEVEAQNTFKAVMNVNTYCPECGADLGAALSAPAHAPTQMRTPASGSLSETPRLQDEH